VVDGRLRVAVNYLPNCGRLGRFPGEMTVEAQPDTRKPAEKTILR
jgi:hypothetical protein